MESIRMSEATVLLDRTALCLPEETRSIGARGEATALVANDVFKKERTYYPSFGEKIEASEQPLWKHIASKISFVVIRCLSNTCTTLFLLYDLYKGLFHYRLTSALQRSPMNREIGREEPCVGRYYTSNVLVTEKTDEGYEWKQKLIRSAETSIELSANYAGGKDFLKILDLIEERLLEKQCLKVHLLLNPDLLESEDRNRLRALQEEYPERFFALVHTTPIHIENVHTEENHVKLLVVDEKYFVTGGTR